MIASPSPNPPRGVPGGRDLSAPPLPDPATVSLFFDFDGTLVELAPTPDAIIVDDALGMRLARLSEATGGRVAIVTGRSIAQIDRLMGRHAEGLAIAGSHGAERRTPAEGHVLPARTPELEAATEALRTFAEAERLVFEAKTLGVSLHYRTVPEREAVAREGAARIAGAYGLSAHPGKMMVEVRLPGDKGAAVHAMMQDPAMAGTKPWFFGDDVTDEDGFAAAAALSGAGVLIDPPRDTAATYRLDDVAALRGWIDALLARSGDRATERLA
ncbi:trehalose 6-phosphate phosphatase [Sphingomonas metalli]|uniref:Trehalose 6-phosphate phosphatase n=1 Tax=Sphingomonas metalli TaxID=1779358 RepID=A0A916T9M8_9SPHN|nr:trehalose-phosphatase [Sphingomonas metalli]GGB37079.1 trehalose 6-phosphate phosphatase [Sphingomonas metalli]